MVADIYIRGLEKKNSDVVIKTIRINDEKGVATDRSPTGGPNERGAGEGSHTVAPPWTRYPVALGSESLGDSSKATQKRETPGGPKQVGNPRKGKQTKN